MKIILAGFAAVAALSATAFAQLSVTTIGANDAAQCFQNANNSFSRDTSPCDKALRDFGTTRGDAMKTHVNRGIIHNRNNDVQAAIDDFNAALEIDASSAEAYLNRGNSYFRAGMHDRALGEYERALELDVVKPWAAWYNIGLVYDAKKQPGKAREAYEQALALNPGFTLAQLKLDARH